jgi:hypothetical protein
MDMNGVTSLRTLVTEPGYRRIKTVKKNETQRNISDVFLNNVVTILMFRYE